MPKNADGPPRGHMGFGYKDHHAAGIPYIPERSAADLNAELRTRQAERGAMVAELERLRRDLPDIAERAGEMTTLGWSPADILFRLRQQAGAIRHRREVLDKSRGRLTT